MQSLSSIIDVALVQKLLWGLIILAAILVCQRVAVRGLNHLLNKDDVRLPSSSIIINIARATIWAIGGSVILDSCFGINANALVTALGVGGIALSLGLSDTLSNLIGGLLITFMGLVKPGDNIQVGTDSGIVQDVSWHHTTIKDALGQTIVIPNANISKNTVSHLLPFGRVTVPITVKDPSRWPSTAELADDLCRVSEEVISPISSFDRKPYVLFSEIGDFGIKGKIIFIVSDDSKTFEAADACVRAIAPLII